MFATPSQAAERARRRRASGTVILAGLAFAIDPVSGFLATIFALPAAFTVFPVTGCTVRNGGIARPGAAVTSADGVGASGALAPVGAESTMRFFAQPWKMSVFMSGKRRSSRIFHVP